ncbi:MAG: MBL fold metallo-hydrolase [Candidatus Latescibacter sp.]|nr:MBL fold metallo-hydrolase [Candidatus Latescibacter sp.]
MLKLSILITLCMVGYVSQSSAQKKLQEDVLKTSLGDLRITFIGHASLMFTFNGMVIHVDPVSAQADYSLLPKADLVLITHEHGDHLDSKALDIIRTDKTKIILTNASSGRVRGGMAMKNGDSMTVDNLPIEVVPAYNIVNKRPDGNPFHPKGVGNGYIITFGDKRVYIAGDSENTPEMKALKNIDAAFLPMNLPYTMTPEMVADAAKAFQPKILYPYHYGETDPSRLVQLLKDSPNIDVRIRSMK